MSFLSDAFLSSLIFGSVTAAVPLLLAACGEQMSEKAGVMNIGLEGMILLGAYVGFLVAFYLGSIWLGFLAGALAGGIVAFLVIAIPCVWMAMNQVIIGLALTLVVQGLTALLQYFQFSHTYPRLPAPVLIPIPLLSQIKIIGPGLFDHQGLVYISVVICFGLSLLYRFTYFGMNLTAAGSKPAALDAAGVDVATTRTVAVVVTGLLAGLGGAYMSEIGGGLFVPLMTNGAGYIAIVLAMLARGKPSVVLGGSIIYGACLSATTALQVTGMNIPTDVIQMLPFAAVMIILVAFGRKASLPAELGIPYLRGQRG
jgi:general nucleoside transport system permease protein